MDLQPTDGATRPAIDIRYQVTANDLFRAGLFAGRQSDVTFGIGVALLLAAGTLVVSREFIGACLTLLLGISIVTGLFAVPLVWWTGRQSGLLGTMVREVIDSTGIAETTPRISAHASWSAYRDVTETRDGFYLSNGMTLSRIPKRVLSDPQIAELRRLVDERGLLRRPRRLRRALAVVSVLAVMTAIGLASMAVTLLTVSPRLDLASVVDGDIVRVHATTDLPDGALVSIEIIQVDEYARAVAAGEPARVESPWVQYEYRGVLDGAFDVTFDTSAWPPGRARVIAFFELSVQPDDVVDRYGRNGERLSGPNVKDDPEYGRHVQVRKDVILE